MEADGVNTTLPFVPPRTALISVAVPVRVSEVRPDCPVTGLLLASSLERLAELPAGTETVTFTVPEPAKLTAEGRVRLVANIDVEVMVLGSVRLAPWAVKFAVLLDTLKSTEALATAKALSARATDTVRVFAEPRYRTEPAVPARSAWINASEPVRLAD